MSTPINSDQQIFPDDPFGGIKKPVTNQVPLPEEVKLFHTKADTDSSALSIHHTLGIKNTQASPGDHIHDGKTSKKLMSGITVSGSRGGNAALGSLITALANAFGFTDSTTP